jgi:hypothetical protein
MSDGLKATAWKVTLFSKESGSHLRDLNSRRTLIFQPKNQKQTKV